MTDLSLRTRTVALLRNGKWSRWISRGTWTLIDRGLFALSNFALNVILARWMAPEAYGAFAVAFSIFLMIGGAQSTIITGPFLIYAPRRYRERYQAYLGIAIRAHFALSFLVSICLALVGAGFLLWGSHDTGTVILTLAVAGPFILVLWLLRSSSYAHLQAKRAAGSGAIYMVLLVAGTYLLQWLSILSPTTALLLMAIASLAVAIWLAIRQKARLFEERLFGAFGREVMIEHWRYAAWMLPARLLDAGRRNLFFFVLPIWSGLEGTGAARALMNLTMPMGFIEHSFSLITAPALVRARNNGTMREKVILAMVFFVGMSVAYGAILILLQEWIMAWLYADRYGGYADLIWLFALLPIVNAVSMVLSSVLRALEQPKRVFWARLGGAVTAATVGVGAVALGGVAGAIIGLLASACAIMVTLLWLVRSAARSGEMD